MDKLIELLQEFNKEKGWNPGLLYEGFGVRKGDLNFIFRHSQFPFIEWLVENDKIDRLTFCESGLAGKYTDFELNYDTPREDYINMLLMELAIQDEPIDYLISILK